MTTDEFNRVVEELEISMLDMTPEERFEVLLNRTQDRYRLTGQVYTITDLMTILHQLNQLNDGYVHLSLCRAICNLLYIYDN